MTIRVKEEYQALLPTLPKEEYASLKASISQDGLHFPIVVNKEGFILDGHNRFKICNELDIKPRFEEKNFENPLLEKRFVIEANLKRRHLTIFQKVEMALPLLEIEKELASERMLNGTLLPIGSKGNASGVEIISTFFILSLTTYGYSSTLEQQLLASRTHSILFYFSVLSTWGLNGFSMLS